MFSGEHIPYRYLISYKNNCYYYFLGGEVPLEFKRLFWKTILSDILLDQEGVPVLAAMRYIKYLDKTGKSSNTQKTYCYSLKQFFTYLKEVDKDYEHIRLEDLVDFVGWLNRSLRVFVV